MGTFLISVRYFCNENLTGTVLKESKLRGVSVKLTLYGIVFLEISFLYKNIEQNENSNDKTNTVLKAIETGHLIFVVALFVEI